MDVLQVILRILHIGSAMALGGALLFQFFALHPALARLAPEVRLEIRSQLVRRWSSVVWAGIALLLVTGLVNFLLYKVPQYRGQPYAGIYHALFGVKLLLSLALFHPAALLNMPGERFDKYRERASFWLGYCTLLLALIVIVAAVLRYLPTFYD